MAVYVIECAGLLKIGYSDNPERRVAKLFQSASRYSAPRAAYEARGTQRLVHVIDGATKYDEHVIHTSLDEYGIGCEWFVNEPAVLEFVQSFEPGSRFTARIPRPDGDASLSMPRSELGGCNHEAVMQAYAKSRQRAAARTKSA